MSEQSQVELEKLFAYEATGPPLPKKADLEKTAKVLRIPDSERETPGNREFISIVSIAGSLYSNLHEAISQQNQARYLKHRSDKGSAPNPEAWTTDLGQRYTDAKGFAFLALTLLHDGYHAEEKFSPSSLDFYIGTAIKKYGLQVMDGVEETEPSESTNQSAPRVMHNLSENVGQRFAQTANRLGIPQERWRDPGIFQYVGILIGVENLAGRCEQAQVPPEALPQGGLPVLQRYQFVSRSMDVLTGILEEGFQGGKVDPSMIRSNLNAALVPFHKRVIPTAPTRA